MGKEKMKFGHLFLCMGLTILFAGCQEEDEPINNEIINYSVKVSSFNIRFDNPADGKNNWHNRKSSVVQFIKAQNMQIVGMQEALNNQFNYLVDNLGDYQSVGVGREDGQTKGEYAPIFFLKDEFTLLDSGTFWLSQTPAEPSIGWDAVLERICTYAILQDNRNDREIHFYNTHFDHVGDEARIESARLIMDSIAAKSSGNWVVLTGDLNAEPDDLPYDVLISGGLDDAFFSKARFGPVGTFNGFNLDGPHQRRIDYILMNGFSPEYYENNNLIVNGNYISDHFPVLARLEYRPL
ncbi:MAG TPA: endonuclease/exonuclease/phosphatase [Cytophagales bacterium]|jgi:endonuclease/exonuclease/phosphatase family metal-dependent hydrolase|nr:endonuclease/exonuclease/phosphatase [Cytophagales bacterium]